MMQDIAAFFLFQIIIKTICFLSNILSGQKRNLCQNFRRIYRLLEGSQGFCFFYHMLDFIFCHGRFFRCQGFCQFRFLLCCQTGFRIHNDSHLMRVVQQPFTNQSFKIAIFHVFTKPVKGIAEGKMHQRIIFIIQPAVKTLKTIHQTFGECAKICFPIFKFCTVETCGQGTFIQTIFCQSG